MAVFEASEGVIKCLPEAGSLKGSLEPENSQMTSDILQNTAVMSTLQVVDNSTKSLETTDNLLASRKPVMFRDVQSEKRVHAVESLYHSLKEASASQLLRASVAGKSAMKKPMRAGVSRSHEVGTSEAVSLKQALRSLTLAQASEMASLKRVSRTPGSAHLVDADAIKQRYRAVLDPQMLEPSSSKNLPRARDISYKKECVIPKVSEKAPEISHLSNGCSSSSLSVGETSLSSVATTSEEKSDNQSIGVVHLSENNKFNREAKDCLHQFENPDEVSSSTEFPYAVRTCSNGSGSSQVMEATESSDTGAVASSSNVGHGIRNAREYQPSTSKKMQKSKQRDCVEVSKSTASRGSTSSGVSDESCCSSLSSSGNRPHMSNDVRWEAIRAIRTKDGCLGLKHFRLLKRLGCGDIGNVYLTELIGTRCFFAMKVMDNESLASQKRMLRAQTEREILQMLDHPFLPTLYTHFETDRFSCLVMEFCPGGDLHILRQRQPGGFFPEQAARFYVAEVLLALEYLHMLGVVYRDLKPENVLVRDDGHIMLSDFDLSLRCADVNPTLIHTTPHDDDDDDDDDEDADADTADAAAADTATAPKRTSTFCISPACADPVPSCFGPGRRRTRTRTRTRARTRARPRAVATATATATAVATVVAEPTGARSNSVVGTHEYLAPEIIRNEGHGSGVDWWTLGVLLYELLFGRTPFKGPNHAATLHNVAAAPLCFPPHHSSSSSSSASPSPNVSAAAKDLLRRLLAKDAVRRLGGRRGSADIKCHPFFHGLNWALIRCATPPHVPGPYYSSSPSPSSVM